MTKCNICGRGASLFCLNCGTFYCMSCHARLGKFGFSVVNAADVVEKLLKNVR
jgi:hypothetical protein